MENTQSNEKPKQVHLTKEQRVEQAKEIARLSNEENMTLKEIAEKLNLKSADNVGKKLKREGYIKVNGKYKLKSEEVEQKEQADSEEDMSMDKIKDIIKILEDVNERLSKLEVENKKGIMVSNEVMNYKPFSIRADESIMNDFDTLAKSFSNVSKSYLISIALKDFVSKYSDNNKND